MSLFAGIGDTTPSASRGVFLTDGEYTLSVCATKLIESKKTKKTFFVVEAKIVESSSENHREGQLITWLCKMGGDWPEYALADIKAFTMAASGASDEEIDEAFMKEVVAGEGDLLAGKKVMCSVNTIETKAGTEFAKHSFAPYAVGDA
tara:strand:+ start:1670 stop:2113 length:444 start_codon:yes stop_codon:yes gene_type:complete